MKAKKSQTISEIDFLQITGSFGFRLNASGIFISVDICDRVLLDNPFQRH